MELGKSFAHPLWESISKQVQASISASSFDLIDDSISYLTHKSTYRLMSNVLWNPIISVVNNKIKIFNQEQITWK